MLKLFGASLAVDTGIKGQRMPGTSNTPQRFASPFDATMKYFGAEGIPITCLDDANKFNCRAADAGERQKQQRYRAVHVGYGGAGLQ